jgi:hypothetical protein
VGTDATALVEVRVNDKWIPVIKPIWPNEGFQHRGEQPLAATPTVLRDYALFSVLADVRNRTGRGKSVHIKDEIEGIPVEYDYDTDDGGHDPLVPIATPRGVPEDASKPWRQFVKANKHRVHDMTWLTLTDLLAADWDQVIYEQAVVYEDEYLRWKDTGEAPKMGARSVGGPGLRIVNEVEYAAGVRGERQTAVDFRWTGKTVREEASKAWWATLGMMTLIAPDNDPQRVRLLLAFDS